MNIKKIGDTTVGEAPESGAITVSDTMTRTIVERGMYEDLYARLPERGDQWGQEEWWVTGASLAPNPGGTGTLTITLADTPQGAGDGAWTPGNIIREVEWSRLEKPVVTNQMLMGTLVGTLLQATIAEIEAWRNSPQQRKRLYQVPRDDLTREANPNNNNDWVSLEGAAKKVAQKEAAGKESFFVFSPVIRQTTVYFGRPTTGGCGTIQTPPISVGNSPAGKPYVYLKVADTARQQTDGTWQRIEEWQGAEEWDTDLYKSG